MGITIYQSITPSERDQEIQGENSLLCGSSRSYEIRKWFGIRRSTVLLIMYILAYFIYLVGGSVLFTALEQEHEELIKTNIRNRKRDFIYNNPGVDPNELEKLIIDITHHGVSPLEKSNNNSNWSFGQSFLFTVTIVTTIGYGHINPVTPAGKLTCMVYCVLGIPFTLVFLSALVQRLLGPTFSVLSKLMAKLSSMENLEIRLMHLATMGVLLIVFAFLLPAGIFWYLEPGWSFLDSFYFVFISLTTIGLGDYIPGDNDQHSTYRDIYKTTVGIYLLTGLVMLSLTLTVYYDIPQLNLGLALHRHRDILDSGDIKNSEVSLANGCNTVNPSGPRESPASTKEAPHTILTAEEASKKMIRSGSRGGVVREGSAYTNCGVREGQLEERSGLFPK